MWFQVKLGQTSEIQAYHTSLVYSPMKITFSVWCRSPEPYFYIWCLAALASKDQGHLRNNIYLIKWLLFFLSWSSLADLRAALLDSVLNLSSSAALWGLQMGMIESRTSCQYLWKGRNRFPLPGKPLLEIILSKIYTAWVVNWFFSYSETSVGSPRVEETNHHCFIQPLAEESFSA